MKDPYRRWACGLLAVVAVLLAACAAVVYTVDPCLYYRLPTKWQPVFFNERYQSAGMLKNVDADTVVLGTSMVANYRASQAEEIFGGTASRITIPDGYLSEFDQVVDLLFRGREPRRVIFGMDLNIMIREESGGIHAMPEYLYNANPLDDVKYLLNKDTLYYSVYVLAANRWGQGQDLDEGFTWDQDIWWNHMTALDNYVRPEQEEQQPADVFLEDVDKNLAVVEKWLQAHPDTEFDIFLPPYSILFWDKTARMGRTEAMFAALEEICGVLLPYENVRLYAFLLDPEIVLDLDYYCDYIHHSNEAAQIVLEKIAADEGRLTAENVEETLANWRDFVVNYDYEPYWTNTYWWAWDKTHSS